MLSKTVLKISTYSASGENFSKCKKSIFPGQNLYQFIYIYFLSILVHFITSKWSLQDIVESNSFITPLTQSVSTNTLFRRGVTWPIDKFSWGMANDSLSWWPSTYHNITLHANTQPWQCCGSNQMFIFVFLVAEVTWRVNDFVEWHNPIVWLCHFCCCCCWFFDDHF